MKRVIAGTAATPALLFVSEITLDQLDVTYNLSLSADPPTTIHAQNDQLFGLIHGFGFAGALQSLSLRGTRLVMPLLTFNVGLETAQLLALTIIAWQISIIARARAARIALAACAGFVAVSWIVERAFNAPNPLSPWARVLLQTPERLALVLLAFALIAFRHQRRRQQQPGDKTPGRDRLASSDAGEHSFVLQ